MFEIGNSLREARLRQGVELPEAEAATKIRGKYLRSLEDERFETLPSQTYVKGFLRAYAEFLGLDGQLYVDEYNSRYAGGDEDGAVRPRRYTPPSRHHRRLESSVLVVALAGISVATALVVVAWKWGGPEEAQIPNLAASDTPAATSTAPAEPAGEPPTTTTTAEPETTWVALVVTAARGNSLLTVHRGAPGGRLLFTGTLERGESLRFTGERLYLDLGDPANVTATLDGQPVAVPAEGTSHSLLVASRAGIERAPAG